MRKERWKRAPFPQHRGKIAVMAHRGAHAHAPENSLAALKAAIALGVDFVECDLRTTRDGQIAILHDSTLDRTTDGKGAFAERTLAELKTLTLKGSTERIPTFEELLQTAKGQIGFYLDCKAVEPAQALTLLRRYIRLNRVLAYTTPEQALVWKRLAPELCVMTSPPDTVRTPEALTTFLTEWPFELLDGPYDLPAETIAAARRLGTHVWADIQNPGESPAQWEPALRRGVTGLQTDHPAELVAYLKTSQRR